MAYSTAYSGNMYGSKVLDYSTNNEWISKVAADRSQMYQEAYQNIDALKSQALNLNFLNKTAQEKANGYNKEISDFFKSNDLKNVDLSDMRVANSYMNVFNKIAEDTDLNRTYRVDKEIRSTLSEWDRAAKNPSKTGYSSVNHNVWVNEHLNPYMNEKDLSKASVAQPGNYDPYYDYQKDLVGLKGLVKLDGNKYEIPDGKGGKTVVDVTEFTPQKAQMLLAAGLKGEAVEQIRKEGKSNFYSSYNAMTEAQQLTVGSELYKTLKNDVDEKKAYLTREKDRLTGQMNAASPNDKPKFEEKIAEYDNLIAKTSFDYSEGDFNKMSKTQLASWYGANYHQSKINQMATVLSSSVRKVSQVKDENYWAVQNYGLAKAKYLSDIETDKAKLAIDYQELAIKQQEADTKANAVVAKLGKDAAKMFNDTGGMFIGIAEGGNAAVVKHEDLYKEIEGLRKEYSLKDKTLSEADIKAVILKGKAETPLEAKILELSNGNTDSVSVGYIQQGIKNKISKGELGDYFKTVEQQLKTKERLYSEAWNAVSQTYGQNPFTEQGRRTLLESRNEDPDSFNTLLQSELNRVSGTYGYTSRILATSEVDKDYKVNDQKILSAINNPATLKQLGLSSITSDMVDMNNVVVNPNGTLSFSFANTITEKQKGYELAGTRQTITIPTMMKGDFSFGLNQTEQNFKHYKRDSDSYKGYTIDFKPSTVPGQIVYKVSKGDKLIFDSANAWDNEGNNRSVHLQTESIETAIRTVRKDIDNGVLK